MSVWAVATGIAEAEEGANDPGLRHQGPGAQRCLHAIQVPLRPRRCETTVESLSSVEFLGGQHRLRRMFQTRRLRFISNLSASSTLQFWTCKMIEQAHTLPCGHVIPNRLCKSAMTEGLADSLGRPTAALERLYSTWAAGGAGMLMTGNIMVDARYQERAGNVVIDRLDVSRELQSWARVLAPIQN